MDVSENVADHVPLRGLADLTFDPGAHILVQLPQFENDDLEHVLVVEPTAIAHGTKAGEKLQASEFELPPATTTTTPDLTAAFTTVPIAC